jgi:hypothetical protein
VSTFSTASWKSNGGLCYLIFTIVVLLSGKELSMLSVFPNRHRARCYHQYVILLQYRFLLAALILAGLTGCTSIGPTGVQPDIDMGPNVELRLCIYKDVNVSNRRAAGIIAAIQKEFAQYGLIIKVPSIKPWQRPAFDHQGILRDIVRRPLEPPFDRSLVLVSRDVRDLLWGSLLPEILGAVETVTHTKGYVVAEIGSLNQLLCFQSPQKAAVHEFYHMLGVDHMDGATTICQKIARLKRSAIENRHAGRDFFPGISSSGKLYLARTAVDRRFGLTPKMSATLAKP